MEKPKVLIASPVFDGMKYCINSFINSVKEIDYPKDILLFDNSVNPSFYEELIKIDKIKVLRLESMETSNLKRLVETRNKILSYAKENNYDYLLMLDCDVLPPKDVINKLLLSKKDIISGLYHNFFKINGNLEKRPVVWRSLTDKEFEIIKSKYKLPDLVETKELLRRFLTKEEEESKKVFDVMIASAGCMLLSKNTFDLTYGVLDIPINMHTSDDIYFFRKAREKGFTPYCDTSIICEHLLKGKFIEKDGKLNHPINNHS